MFSTTFPTAVQPAPVTAPVIGGGGIAAPSPAFVFESGSFTVTISKEE